jgi:hypothetical protein
MKLSRPVTNQLPALSDKELLEVFPQARQIVPALIEELGQQKNSLLDAIINLNASVNNESEDESYRYFWKSWLITPVRDELKLVDQKLTRLRRLLRVIEGRPLPKGALEPSLILAAKQVPLEALLEQPFKRTGQMLVGLCPFQEERTPSFYIYTNTNRCWCFGCNQGGNTVDTYMKLHDCNFKEAVLGILDGKV